MTGPLAQQFAQVCSDIAECCHDCDDGCQRDKTVAALSVIERHLQDMETALAEARDLAIAVEDKGFDRLTTRAQVLRGRVNDVLDDLPTVEEVAGLLAKRSGDALHGRDTSSPASPDAALPAREGIIE